jgi:Flp pilus assembly protein TadG
MWKPMKISLFRAALNRSGVAALEMALLVPVMLLIFFGMIDLTALIADARRVSYAANVAADMVTRLSTPTTPANVAIAYDGVELVMETATTGVVRVEVFAYFVQSSNPVLRWSVTNGVGPDCVNPSTTGLANLMTQGNDIIIAVVCANHTPIVANIITERFMGTTDILLQRQVTMRPRQSNQLICPNSCI